MDISEERQTSHSAVVQIPETAQHQQVQTMVKTFMKNVTFTLSQ